MTTRNVPLSDKAIRFVLAAIATERKRLEGLLDDPDEDVAADAGNDLGFYSAISDELEKALRDG